MNGNVSQTSGTMNINGGKLLINGDYLIENTNNSNRVSYGYLQMTTADSYVLVNGDFVTRAYYNHTGKLTEGTLEVKGDFTQVTTAYDQNFYASGNHKVILSGEQKQKITFGSNNSQFNVLEISKSLDNGYTFSRTPLWNELIEKTVDNESPTTPSNLRTTRVTSSVVVLKWDNSTDNVAVAGYYVYCNGEKISDTTSATYAHENLKSNTKYQYYICAYDVEKNISEKSSTLIVSTSSSTTAPIAPVSLTADVVDEDNVKLVWTMPSNIANIEGYRVYRDDLLIATVSDLGYLDKDVEPGKHIYYVRTLDDAGNISNIRNSIYIDNKKPTAPVINADSLSDTSVMLSWSVFDDDIVNFELCRNNKIIANISSQNYIDTNLSIAELYEYHIIAIDDYGNRSAKSNTAVFCSSDNDAPYIVSITPQSGKYGNNVNMSISARDNISVNKILIQYSYNNNDWLNLDEISCKPANRTAIISYKIKASQFEIDKIYLRAIAYDSSDNKSDENNVPVVNYSLDNNAPVSPQNLSLIVSEGEHELIWEMKDTIDFEYFRIYRSVNSNEYCLLEDNYHYCNYYETNYELGVEYSYYITSVDKYGNESEPSKSVNLLVESDLIVPKVNSIYPRSGTDISENQTLSIAVSDNYRLKHIDVLISEYGKNEFETIYSSELFDVYNISRFTLPTDDMKDGKYIIKILVKDSCGNENEEYYVNYNYESCKLSKPQLSISGEGWKNSLSWEMENELGLAGYRIYKKSSSDKEYTNIANIIGTSYIDYDVIAGKSYSYKIAAIDAKGNIVEGKSISAVPTDDDDILPVSRINVDLFTFENANIIFDGSGSYDNHFVQKYEWNCGDGFTSDSNKFTHSFSKSGTYKVTLSVYDSAGNMDVSTVDILVSDPKECGKAVFNVKNENGLKLTDAFIYCDMGLSERTYKTNSNGQATIVIEKGVYKFYIYKDGYLPIQKEIEIGNDVNEINVVLEKKELVSGEITTRVLNYNEIKSLGIDTSLPENQHVYEYTATIEEKFYSNSSNNGSEGENGESYNNTRYIVFHANDAGEIIERETNITFTDRNGNKRDVVWQVMSNDTWNEIAKVPTVAYLSVTTNISWVKEFFDVELTVVNNADKDFSIESAYATLSLPSGLTLADTYRKDSLTQSFDSIGGGRTKSVTWIIRGDKSGSYNLTADFNGVLMPFNENINAKFSTKNPLVVYGGTALKLVVDENVEEDGDRIVTTFTLTNISDRDVYITSIDFNGYTLNFKVGDMYLFYPNGMVEVIPWNDGIADENSKKQYLPIFSEYDDEIVVLKPNEKILGRFVTRRVS